MGFFRLRLELRAIRSAIEELRKAIEEHASTIHATEERERYEHSARKTVNAVVAFDDKTVRDTQAENERQYRTQRSIKHAAWSAFAAAVIYAGIAAYQAKEMRRATIAAQRSADAAYTELRPWVKITDLKLRDGGGPIKTLMFHQFPGGPLIPPFLQVNVSVVNVGHTVAQDAEVFPELFTGVFDSSHWYDIVTKEEHRFCDSIADRREHTGASAVVFPSDSKDWNVGAGGTLNVPADNFAAAFIVCVNYRGIPGSKFQTQAWYGLYEDRSVRIGNTDMDASHLQLIRNEAGDHAY